MGLSLIFSLAFKICFLLDRLKSDLKKKETDLLGAQRELKNLQNKFEQQQQVEADLSRKANKSSCKKLYSQTCAPSILRLSCKICNDQCHYYKHKKKMF